MEGNIQRFGGYEYRGSCNYCVQKGNKEALCTNPDSIKNGENKGDGNGQHQNHFNQQGASQPYQIHGHQSLLCSQKKKEWCLFHDLLSILYFHFLLPQLEYRQWSRRRVELPTIAKGTFLIYSLNVRVLFDSGSSHSSMDVYSWLSWFCMQKCRTIYKPLLGVYKSVESLLIEKRVFYSKI